MCVISPVRYRMGRILTFYLIEWQTTARDRRRVPTKTRSQLQSQDSGAEEEQGGASSAFAPTSPMEQSAHTELSPPAPWTEEQQRAAEEAYQTELADYQIYDVMRKFACAARALALYDCRLCLDELEKLPHQQQRSASVMAMVGKAHYELGQYPAVSQPLRSFGVSLASDPNSCLPHCLLIGRARIRGSPHP